MAQRSTRRRLARAALFATVWGAAAAAGSGMVAAALWWVQTR